ncbi:hypothetical protein A3Q56_04709, partial [Intoshia linei]
NNCIELEWQLNRLKIQLRQKDEEFDEQKELLEKLKNERNNLSEVVRQEWADRLISLEHEIEELKSSKCELIAKINQMKMNYEAKIEKIENDQNVEISEINDRVKEGIIEKNMVIKNMKNEYNTLLKRTEYFESCSYKN